MIDMHSPWSHLKRGQRAKKKSQKSSKTAGGLYLCVIFPFFFFSEKCDKTHSSASKRSGLTVGIYINLSLYLCESDRKPATLFACHKHDSLELSGTDSLYRTVHSWCTARINCQCLNRPENIRIYTYMYFWDKNLANYITCFG